MRTLLICAIVLTAAMGLGGCFFIGASKQWSPTAEVAETASLDGLESEKQTWQYRV